MNGVTGRYFKNKINFEKKFDLPRYRARPLITNYMNGFDEK
jgi:hypothetical protein